ncbi:MAG TPA: papain-like cysteine protease family protein [Longimicrobium sp.]|nr:papain-like cysteine protease family protein [Longimicrobium sp.]
MALELEIQELGRWCWAAISASLGRFYGTRAWRQHEAAAAVLGFDCSGHREDAALRARCDVNARLDDALALAGCHSHWSAGRPTFERVVSEIGASRPVCVQLEWRHGGSHYVVLSGYHADTREVHVLDPLHGPSVQPFDGFPSGYRGTGGAWRATFWTAPPRAASTPPTTSAPPASAPPAGALHPEKTP